MSGIPNCADHDPPYPALEIVLSRGGAEQRCHGKIDTGASCTCVPQRMLDAINAPSDTDVATVIGYDGIPSEIAIYRVNISVIEPGWPAGVASEFIEVEVLAIPAVTQEPDDATEVLIGRDLLRNWALLLEGPRDMLHVQT